MRMSKLFFHSLREAPAEAELVSHQLMLRAGLIRQVTSGIFEYLPLGMRVKHKIERLLREEMDRVDGQEMVMPVALPAELWRKSGRWYAVGDDLMRMKDRTGRDMCLAMTHEEVMADLAASDPLTGLPSPQHFRFFSLRRASHPGAVRRRRHFARRSATLADLPSTRLSSVSRT